MRDNTSFAAVVFFAILGIIATTIFSSVIISQNKNIKSIFENRKQI